MDTKRNWPKENAASARTEHGAYEKQLLSNTNTKRVIKTSILTSKLREHWISCRGHRFGYDAEVIE